MTATKDIRNKIFSIKKTQKITRAMQMVAGSKMRKAQQRMELSLPYANKIKEVMGHVVHSHSEYKHKYLVPRADLKRVGFIVVSTDRGLCGGLNINLFRVLNQQLKHYHEKEIGVDLCLFGSKAVNFFRHTECQVLANAQGFGDNPKVADLIGGVKIMLDAYAEHKIDRLFIVYNKFVNKMVQKPCVDQLLPIDISAQKSNAGYWDYIYEPDSKPLLNTLVARYIETQVYQSVVDNLACEQSARMLAMKNATDSADSLIDRLNIIYNKARQASITQEIAEIIGGAESI